jgi:ABC-type phosphate transport system substrate-binding protein
MKFTHFLFTIVFTASSLVSAEVVVVMGTGSTVPSLSREQVSNIYLSKTRQFPNGGTPVPLMLAQGSNNDEFFTKVLNRSDAQARAYWARLTFTGKGIAPRELKDSNEIKQTLSSNPYAIGFVQKSEADSNVVKIVLTP